MIYYAGKHKWAVWNVDDGKRGGIHTGLFVL